MAYKLTITKTVPNPEYDAQKASELMRNQFYHGEIPSKMIEERRLEVEVTDDEFRVIKRAVMEIL